MIVYGVEISYFTGKFEAYLRYKGIPYESRNLGIREYLWTVPRKLGATQYPSVELPDGRWMSDTTPMIAWLEGEYPDHPVIPADPVSRFFALLIEDYGDEWLWRPAMHYRWNNAADAELASRRLAEEVVRLPLPLYLRRRWVRHRQTSKFVRRDGVDTVTRPHMDSAYTRLLDRLEPVLAERPFLLGGHPTIADFGLYGSMFRHFSHDPTPARIMRERAPHCWRWVARMWASRGERVGSAELLAGFPPDLEPLLDEVCSTLIPMLIANARAHSAGSREHSFDARGATYRDVPTSQYRVWVLEQLLGRLSDLAGADREGEVTALLDRYGGLVPLQTFGPIASGHDPGGEAPFCGASRMVRD